MAVTAIFQVPRSGFQRKAGAVGSIPSHHHGRRSLRQGVVSDSRARVARLRPYHIVDVHGSNHFLFLQHPREVSAAMRTSLGAQ